MEEKIPTVSFCGFCYRSPASCNSNVANTRNCMKKLACFSEAFCKLYFLEQVMSCNNRKEKKKKKDWKITCKLRNVPHFFIFSPNCYFLPPGTPKPVFCSFQVSNFTAITAAMPCLFWYTSITEYM